MEAVTNNLYLEKWVTSFSEDPQYYHLIKRFIHSPNWITNPAETAMLYALIQKLKPKISLEIGSFFCETTQIMAQALNDNKIEGTIVTLDPFGAERVPAILQSWDSELQSRVDYRSLNSMQYFLELETLGKTKNDHPIGVVFVDGHHNFEYALFDIIRSADHLIPGGVIVVDNLEQHGPEAAVTQFIQWNPAWKLITKDSSALNLFRDELPQDKKNIHSVWGLLISPPGFQVGKHTYKVMKRNISERSIQQIIFNSDCITHPGILEINMCYYSVPYDFHITGKGMTTCTFQKHVDVSDTRSPIKVICNPELLCGTAKADVNICYEIELRYRSDFSNQAYILLNADQPIAFI